MHINTARLLGALIAIGIPTGAAAQSAPQMLPVSSQWLAGRPAEIEWGFWSASRGRVPERVLVRFRSEGTDSYRPASIRVDGCTGPPINLDDPAFAALPGITLRIQLYASPGLNSLCDTRSLTFRIYQIVPGTGNRLQRWEVRTDVSEAARLYGPDLNWRPANIWSDDPLERID
jgi:hypothetical protein